MLFKLFWIFARVAFFSWGGGPASLALMQREVTQAGWVNSSEFADAGGPQHALPGPIAPQVSAYIGYKLAGVPGAVMAVTGTVLPTTLLMLIMIAYFFNIKDSPAMKSMLQAVRPVVVRLPALDRLRYGRQRLRRQKAGLERGHFNGLGQGPDRRRGLRPSDVSPASIRSS